MTHSTATLRHNARTMAHTRGARGTAIFCLLFYTGAWFPVEQRAIRSITGWHRPESYLDEDAYDAGTGTKAGRLLHRLRADHAGLGVVVFTDDIQSEARACSRPPPRSAPQGDAARVRAPCAGCAARSSPCTAGEVGASLGTTRRSSATPTPPRPPLLPPPSTSPAEEAQARRRHRRHRRRRWRRRWLRRRSSCRCRLWRILRRPRVAPWGARTGLLYVGVAHSGGAVDALFLQRVHEAAAADMTRASAATSRWPCRSHSLPSSGSDGTVDMGRPGGVVCLAATGGSGSASVGLGLAAIRACADRSADSPLRTSPCEAVAVAFQPEAAHVAIFAAPGHAGGGGRSTRDAARTAHRRARYAGEVRAVPARSGCCCRDRRRRRLRRRGRLDSGVGVGGGGDGGGGGGGDGGGGGCAAATAVAVAAGAGGDGHLDAASMREAAALLSCSWRRGGRRWRHQQRWWRWRRRSGDGSDLVSAVNGGGGGGECGADASAAARELDARGGRRGAGVAVRVSPPLRRSMHLVHRRRDQGGHGAAARHTRRLHRRGDARHRR